MRTPTRAIHRAILCVPQRGAALLAAMLTVALVATFAATTLWQQWRSVEVESAERSRVQAAWVLTGAIDWARLLLREDGRSGGPDHLGEPWAVPLQEARLSSFLAAQGNVATDSDADVLEAFLSGSIVDMQSRLNVSMLVDDQGKVSEIDLRSFERLFELLGLPDAQLDQLVENLRFAFDASANNRSAAMAPLVPQRLEELAWLGLAPATIAALQPYVAVLPARNGTPVNLNTAPAQVIYASVEGMSMADAQKLVALRARSPFRTVTEAQQAIDARDVMASPMQTHVGIASTFFEVQARLRLDQLVTEERALVRRPPGTLEVTVVQRERGLPSPASTALAQAAAR